LTALALELSPPESKHYGSWRERLDYVARYSRPDEIHVTCERARALGASAVLATLDGRTDRALEDLQSWRDLETWIVVPNMNAFIRDLTDRGPAGAALARFLRLSPGGMWTAGWTALRDLRAMARADFTAAALWLAEMELSAARRLKVRRVFLHPQLAEVALAGRVATLFTRFAGRMGALGLEAGLMTNNPVMAREVLGADFERFAAIVSPCNPKGYKMVPDVRSCEALYRSLPDRFWASDCTAGGHVDPTAAIRHVEGLGLAGAVVDFRTLDAIAGGAPRPQ
jgi:hypothetical protein